LGSGEETRILDRRSKGLLERLCELALRAAEEDLLSAREQAQLE
jgi:hypothetical protein